MNLSRPYVRGNEIARGGMGAVIEAKDPNLGRTIAMKVILSRNAGAVERSRFTQEARVLAELAHPNIVPIHDLGVDEQGRDYYTMKLVQGTTLNDILIRITRREPEALRAYPLNTLLTIFQKVCDAVALAHSRGIIHRDIKPQNIMVGAFGEVLVMDWGLAKVINSDLTDFFRREPDRRTAEGVDDSSAEIRTAPEPASGELPTIADTPLPSSGDMPTIADIDVASDNPFNSEPQTALEHSQLTMEGAVVGTPNFMSPEQAEGRVSDLDHRSDIFSLGGVLYAILTLRPPVSGSSLDEILDKVRNGTIVEPTRLNIPTLIQKAKATWVREIVDATEARSLPHCPRGRVPARLSAVVMMALRRDMEERYQSVEALSSDITAYQSGFATAAEEASLFTLFRLFINRHRTIAGALAVGAVMAVVFMAKIVASEHRATQQAFRASAAELDARKAQAVAENEREAQRIAFARAQTALGEAAIRELNGMEAQQLLRQVPEDLRDANWRYLNARADTSLGVVAGETNGPALAVEPFPAIDSVFAFAGTNGRIALVDSRNGNQLLSFPSIFGNDLRSPFTLSFARQDGEMAIANWDDDRIAIHHALTGQKLREWRAGRPWLIEYSPTRKQLLFSPEPVAGQAVQLRLFDTTTGEALWSYDPGVDWMLAAFHPEGDRIVAALGQHHAVVLNAQTGAEILSLPPTGPLVYRIAVSPDGELAAFGDGQGGVTVVALADGQLVTQFRAGENIIRLLAFTPDGGRLVTLTYPPNQSFHHVRLWDAFTGHALQSVLGVSANSKNGAVHPVTGELVLAGDENKVWSLAQLAPSWVIDSGINPPLARFWPDGETVLANDASGRPRLVALRADGTIKTNWISPIACGRQAVLSRADKGALIGGATFDLAATFYFHLHLDGAQVSQPLMWQATEPLPVLELSPTGTNAWSGAALINPGTGETLLKPAATGQIPLAGRWIDTERIAVVTPEDSGSRLEVRKAADGEVLHSVTNATAIFTVQVSPDGTKIIEGGQDKIIRVRSIANLEIITQFRVHDGAVSALAVHPTEPLIATASEDLTLRIWNYESGALLEELRGPPSPALDLDFSPAGDRLISAGANGLALVWEPLCLRTSDQ